MKRDAGGEGGSERLFNRTAGKGKKQGPARIAERKRRPDR